MKTIHKLVLLAILSLVPAIVLALTPGIPLTGPAVPCVGCDSLTEAPYPETGIWFNPEEAPGSGLNFEIQNGVISGFLYSYSTTGQPEWLMFSGPLVRSERDGVLWELDARLLRVEGGNCFTCGYIPPDQFTTDDGRIVLNFKQRNHLHIRVNIDNLGTLFNQFFVPFTYGSAGKAYFSEQTPYLFPVLGEEQYKEPFLLSFRPVNSAENNLWNSIHTYIRGPYLSENPENKVLTYNIWELQPNGPQVGTEVPPPYGQVICALDTEAEQPGCKVEVKGITYTMPIGNFGDSRFFGEAADGSVIEGFRLEYD